MISATIGMAAMALLFVVFGVLALGDDRRGCGGDCGSCQGTGMGECELESEGSNR